MREATELPSIPVGEIVQTALSEPSLWETDLSDPSLIVEVTRHLEGILQQGMYPSLMQILQ
jgi:hypothetical protein